MQILFLQGNISGEVVTWHLKQQPDICLPSVNTGCLDTISTPGPDLWCHNIIIIIVLTVSQCPTFSSHTRISHRYALAEIIVSFWNILSL